MLKQRAGLLGGSPDEFHWLRTVSHDPLNLNQHGAKRMLASSFCASRPRDATRRMSATELVCAAPSQQRCAQHQLRRSSISSVADATRRMSATELVCASPSQQRLRRSSDSVAAPSQQRSISSVAAASAPSQQHQLRRSSISRRRQCPATMSGRWAGFSFEVVARRSRKVMSHHFSIKQFYQ